MQHGSGRMPYRILNVVGARPNFMKIKPIVRELSRYPDVLASTIVHTGQHYDAAMSAVFFDQLGIPRPDVDLNVGSGSAAQQTAAIMAAFEPVLLQSRADLLLVVGDVNSTVACALVAAKLGIEIAHVEAGLRSYDRSMPEEINRVVTDQLSETLFTTEVSAEQNLRREGIDASKIHFVGNVMIDTLLSYRDRARSLDAPRTYGLTNGRYVMLTLHRPSNVDDPTVFERVMSAVAEISTEMPVVFPVHPRTRPAIVASKTAGAMVARNRLRLLDPLGYLEFIGLMEKSRAVLTDSGGIQEETTILGVPCLTLRDNTERPVTVTDGTNRVVGTNPCKILQGWSDARDRAVNGARTPPFWDGEAARRIVDVLKRRV